MLIVQTSVDKILEKFPVENMKTSNQKYYKIEFDNQPEYLSAYVSGEKDSLEISRQFWREISEECKRVECKKLLIVEDIEEAVSMADIYMIASEIPQLFYGVRIVFVDTHLDHQSLNEFGEIVATNRGVHGKIFNDVEEAKKWLLL